MILHCIFDDYFHSSNALMIIKIKIITGKGYESFPDTICKVAQKTCHLLKIFPQALQCPTGQTSTHHNNMYIFPITDQDDSEAGTIKFSVIESSAHILPHCGQVDPHF